MKTKRVPLVDLEVGSVLIFAINSYIILSPKKKKKKILILLYPQIHLSLYSNYIKRRVNKCLKTFIFEKEMP